MSGARVPAIVLAAALLAAGCTDEQGGTASSPAPQPPHTPAAPAPAASPDAVADPGSPTAAPCRAPATPSPRGAPDDAIRVERASGDLDGDGAADQVITYATDSQDPTFHLRVITDSGHVAQAELDEADASVDVAPLGVRDVGADREVAFVLEGGSASARLVSLWALHDLPDRVCALRRVTVPAPDTRDVLRVGGSTAGGGGLACRDVAGTGAAELIVTSTTRATDGRWEWSEQAFTWPGAGALEEVSQDSGVVDSEQQAADYYGMDCPGVSSP